MSNEPQPAPLRLKPRLNAGQPAPIQETTQVAPPAVASAPLTPAAVPPLPAQSAPAPLPTVVPRPLPPEPVPAPISSTPAPAPTAEDPGKFKLKPRGAASAPSAAAASSSPATSAVAPNAIVAPAANSPTQAQVSAPVIPVIPTAAPGSVPIIKPTLPAAALASPAFAKPAAPGPASGRPNMPIAPLPPGGPVAIPTGAPGPRPQGKMVAQTDEKTAAHGKFAAKLLVALLFVALGLFGVFAYNLWFAGEPASPPIAAKPPAMPTTAADGTTGEPATAPAADSANAANADATKSAAPVVVENPQSLAGKAIAKAQDAVAAHDAALVEPVNDVLAPPTATPSAGAAPAAPVPVEMKPVPTPAVARPVESRPEPGPGFKAFVVNLKVNGVFQGENARAMLNGKMYRLGEVVDAKLGIVFLRVEPEDKRIVFEDAKGAIMSRRY